MQKINSKSTVAVYWDLNGQTVVSGEDISLTIESVERIYDSIEMFKVYGEGYYKHKGLLDKYGVEYYRPEGIRDSEALLIDISLINKDKITDILLISSKAQQLRVHLNQIQSGLGNVKIYISLGFPSINPIPLSDLPVETKQYLLPPKINPIRTSSTEQRNTEKTTINQFPIYQNFQRKKGQIYAHDHLLTYLKELADTGFIMHDAGWLCKNFAQKSRISIEQATCIIKEVEKIGHVYTSERTFGDLKTMFFTSLKLESLSLEVLLWTLRSLKVDEMLPTERAVQSRMKEVFDFKVSQAEWGCLLEVCRGMYKHTHTKSAPEKVKTNYSLFSSYQSLFSNSTPVFDVKEMLDPVTGQKVHVIYPKDEEWESKDQHIKEGDSLGVKNTPDWKAYVDFLSEYFSFCKPGDDSRAIPGGRYGCAQFLKLCGNQRLRECSLGKLSYMVQLSIDEDLLRYHKTLLIWVPSSNKITTDKENNEKLMTIQKTIIEILKDSKDGMSLAQLPLYIRRKLNFSLDISELGFAKLKDLLLTMPEVEIELRGTNHPFAVYKSKFKRNKEEGLKKVLDEILTENIKGLPGQKLEIMLSSKLGYFVNWGEFKCANIYEYIQKKTLGIFEITGLEDAKIVMKSKKKQAEIGHSSSSSRVSGENVDIFIKVSSENGDEDIVPEEPMSRYHKAWTGQEMNRNPYAYEAYFDPFTYKTPPGFN
ncbi:hypothetical protein SteCoe_30024 [Stentor coeruleus]|uniref:HTH OST-type domain-containing protein n=1 Tax=Stentor coeruleus TaxID=5963 RepID=A0A1R2B4I2_9CILI|nr:hypothetical protein SteCoe_30024 [Stentor coeruleus]